MGNFLYIVAIAICNPTIPAEKCSWHYADDLKRYWFYRPNYELCVEYAKAEIEEGTLLKDGAYARIYCLRAETFEQAKSEIVNLPD